MVDRLIKQLVVNSEEFAELLERLATLEQNQAERESLLQAIRDRLNRCNLRYLMDNATLPHQFIALFFTQTKAVTPFTPGQLEQLQAHIEQLSHPRFAQLRELFAALTDWHKAASEIYTQLDRVNQLATERWLQESRADASREALVRLWAQLYDAALAAEFNRPGMQQAQGDLVNAGSRVKLAWSQTFNQMAEELGLPTQQQIAQLVEALDQQRRRIRTLERELSQLREAARG